MSQQYNSRYHNNSTCNLTTTVRRFEGPPVKLVCSAGMEAGAAAGAASEIEESMPGSGLSDDDAPPLGIMVSWEEFEPIFRDGLGKQSAASLKAIGKSFAIDVTKTVAAPQPDDTVKWVKKPRNKSDWVNVIMEVALPHLLSDDTTTDVIDEIAEMHPYVNITTAWSELFAEEYTVRISHPISLVPACSWFYRAMYVAKQAYVALWSCTILARFALPES